ncbi:alpha/beta hydrolase [Actinocatenispora rupis]|uniref:DUF1023 domain-containing protein n=1 Tax=Actinocatenispora rupis TaxID=519421 RepID=A0A8J3N8N1_9ACTN|nr:alpha/beta hydrolase [Actinocatenispora rupis]GID10266.1 hypothetical protein Aru02nite_11550 [Actinocatenispora rupis]
MRRWLVRTVVGLASAAVMVTPTAGTLLSPASAAPAREPVGAAAWDAHHLPDPVRTDPVAAHRFLAGRADAARLALEYPGVVGGLDGAPVSLRYAANRVAMRAAGGRYAGWHGNFLLFDPRGNGRVAQVFGDLTTADRIAVLVPGVDSRAENFVRGLGGKSYRAPATQAANLYRAAHDDRLAVIAWLGYDTPRGVGVAAAREDLAATGSVALQRFLTGLTVVRPGATIALFGHSYGSTVIGLAASRLPRQVTDIAVFGSPGMGVDRAAGLHTRATVWAGQAERDWIGWVPAVRLFGLGHGTRPADPAFGARVFPTADVPDHDHYLAPGTDSLVHLARIATGTEARS